MIKGNKKIAVIFSMIIIFLILSLFATKTVEATQRIGNYEIDGEYITKILPNTTLDKFINELSTNAEVKDKVGNDIASSDIVKTGMTAKIGNDTYKLAILGDVNGDGKISISDLTKMNLHNVRLQKLTDANQKAADINGDGKVSISDVVIENLVSVNLRNIKDFGLSATPTNPTLPDDEIYATLYTDGTLGLCSTNSTIPGKTIERSYGEINKNPIYTLVPWGDNYYTDKINNVVIVDKILPSSTMYWFSGLKLNSLDLSNLDTSRVTNMSYMFDSSTIKNLDFSNKNVENVTTMEGMFAGCEDLTTLNLSNLNAINVTSMERMFRGCLNLRELNLTNFRTRELTSMEEMFSGCHSLQELNLSSLDTSNVTNVRLMFGESTIGSINFSNFNTSSLTDMSEMFHCCGGVTSLDLSSFDTSNVTNMSAMFAECVDLTTVNLSSFDTSNVTAMRWMFGSCENLTSLDLSNFNTSNATDMSYMFRQCRSLTQVLVDRGWTTTNADTRDMFDECGVSNVTNLSVGPTPVYATLYTDGTLGLCANNTTISGKTVSKSYGDISNIVINSANDIPWKDEKFDMATLEIIGRVAPTSTAFWFERSNLRQINNIQNLDTSSVTNMEGMFEKCVRLTNLDLSNFDTSNVTNMSYMFSSCNLTSLDLSSFNTSRVTNMNSMFLRSHDLTEIYVGAGWTTTNADTTDMFLECGVDHVTLKQNVLTSFVNNLKNAYLNMLEQSA